MANTKHEWEEMWLGVNGEKTMVNQGAIVNNVDKIIILLDKITTVLENHNTIGEQYRDLQDAFLKVGRRSDKYRLLLLEIKKYYIDQTVCYCNEDPSLPPCYPCKFLKKIEEVLS